MLLMALSFRDREEADMLLSLLKCWGAETEITQVILVDATF